MKATNITLSLALLFSASFNASASTPPTQTELRLWSLSLAHSFITCGYAYRYKSQLSDITGLTTPAREIIEDLKDTAKKKEEVESLSSFEGALSNAIALDVAESNLPLPELLSSLKVESDKEMNFKWPGVNDCDELAGMYHIYTDHIKNMMLKK